MPYNLPKSIGGDSPANVKWMEQCVSKVTRQKDKKTGGKLGKSKAIAICKSTLIKSKGSHSSAEVMVGFFVDYLDNNEI